MHSAVMRPSQHHPLYGAAFPSPATSGNSASPQKSATAAAFVPHASPSKYDEEGEDEFDMTEDEHEKQKLETRREKNRVKQRNLRLRRANHISTLEQNVTSLQDQNAALSAAIADFRHRERQLDAWIKDLESVLQRHDLAAEVEALRRKWMGTMTPTQRREGDNDPLSTLAQAAASVPPSARQDAGPSVLHPPPQQYGAGARPLWNRGQASPFTWEPAANDSPFEYDVDPRKRKRGSEELAPPPPRPLSGYHPDPLAPPSFSVPWDPLISRPSSSRPQTAPSAHAFGAQADPHSGSTPSGSITDPSPRAMRIESLLSPNPDGLPMNAPTPARPSWSTEMTLIDDSTHQQPRSIEPHGPKWHDIRRPSSPPHHPDIHDVNSVYSRDSNQNPSTQPCDPPNQDPSLPSTQQIQSQHPPSALHDISPPSRHPMGYSQPPHRPAHILPYEDFLASQPNLPSPPPTAGTQPLSHQEAPVVPKPDGGRPSSARDFHRSDRPVMPRDSPSQQVAQISPMSMPSTLSSLNPHHLEVSHPIVSEGHIPMASDFDAWLNSHPFDHHSHLSSAPMHPSITTARLMLLSLFPAPLPYPLPPLPELTPAQQQVILVALCHLTPPHIAETFRARQLRSLPDSLAKLLLEYQSSDSADLRLVLFPVTIIRVTIVGFLKQGLPFDFTRFVQDTLNTSRLFGVPLDPDAWEMSEAFWEEWEGWIKGGRQYCGSLNAWRRRDGHLGSTVVEMILGMEGDMSRRSDAVGKPPGWSFTIPEGKLVGED